MNNEMTPEDLERARGAFDRLVNDAIYQYYEDHKRWPTEVRIPWPKYQGIMNRDHWDVYVPKDINVCVTIPDNLLSGAISCENIVRIPSTATPSVTEDHGDDLHPACSQYGLSLLMG